MAPVVAPVPLTAAAALAVPLAVPPLAPAVPVAVAVPVPVALPAVAVAPAITIPVPLALLAGISAALPCPGITHEPYVHNTPQESALLNCYQHHKLVREAGIKRCMHHEEQHIVLIKSQLAHTASRSAHCRAHAKAQAWTLTQCLIIGMPARHAGQAAVSVRGLAVAYDACGGDARGSSAAPVPPFMPAPMPRPSSRAVARLGARCPSATDLRAHPRRLFDAWADPQKQKPRPSCHCQASSTIEPSHAIALLYCTFCTKQPASLLHHVPAWLTQLVAVRQASKHPVK